MPKTATVGGAARSGHRGLVRRERFVPQLPRGGGRLPGRREVDRA
ncbi:hypothetical protein SNL152K_2931 [Streptomyces sp. NL15-2K]|nr:hypothetical protein SNL152K_2931 [Streptomyces sp. NL15-2K]